MEDDRERLKAPLKAEQRRKLEELGLVVVGAVQNQSNKRDKRSEAVLPPGTTKKEDQVIMPTTQSHTESATTASPETVSDLERRMEKLQTDIKEATFHTASDVNALLGHARLTYEETTRLRESMGRTSEDVLAFRKEFAKANSTKAHIVRGAAIAGGVVVGGTLSALLGRLIWRKPAKALMPDAAQPIAAA
jgi:hypothetical protein